LLAHLCWGEVTHFTEPSTNLMGTKENFVQQIR